MDLPALRSRTPRPHQTRGLLRALRDVNSVGRLAVRAGFNISLEGCLSLDGPVEQGVRYRLRLADGSERVLSIRAGEAALEIAVSGLHEGGLQVERARVAALACDDDGRAVAPDLLARWGREGDGSRAAEHFLRRLVRGVYAA